MAVLRPYIYCEDARVQAEFYAGALGGRIIAIQTYGEVGFGPAEQKDRTMHLEFQAAGVTIFMADSVSLTVDRGSGLDLSLEFDTEEEARTVFEAISEGGEVLMRFERMFWGTMFGRVIDRFGVYWQISSRAVDKG